MKLNSIAVIDFMNADRVIEKLIESETQTRGKIDFEIKRSVKNGIIHKNIKFQDNGVNYDFTEKVKAINLKKFKNYFSSVGLTLTETFGNYNLKEFDVKKSDRLIMVLTN